MASTPPSVVELHSRVLEHLRCSEYHMAARDLRTLLLRISATHEARLGLLVVLAFAHVEAGELAEGLRIAGHAVALAPNHVLARQQLTRARQAVSRRSDSAS
jgi:hypothetical protein